MLGVEGAYGLPEPALGDDLRGLAGVPDVHTTEVRTVRVGIANALDNGHLAGVIEFLERPGTGMKRQRIVEGQNLLGWDAHSGPRVVINAVRIRNDRVHEIVAAGELHHHQYRSFRTHCHRRLPPLHHANWYSFEATINCSRRPTRAALAWRSSEVPQDSTPPWRAYRSNTWRVASLTVSDPISSRQLSTNASGVSVVPRPLNRSTMACIPGLVTSANSFTAKLTRSFSVPPSIHSLPVCQPSTVGGLNKLWPITEVA